LGIGLEKTEPKINNGASIVTNKSTRRPEISIRLMPKSKSDPQQYAPNPRAFF